jgi:hypothetical protein
MKTISLERNVQNSLVSSELSFKLMHFLTLQEIVQAQTKEINYQQNQKCFFL